MPQPPITEFAPAKVNLTLHVTGQRADGYHLLDSLVAFCGIGDWVTATAAPELGLTICGPQARLLTPCADNLCLRAARAMAAVRGPAVRGAAVRGPVVRGAVDRGAVDLGAALLLDKHLPLAAGIGGGSANAAATLRALSRLWNLPLPTAKAVLALGADVPVCLGVIPARMRGIGDRIKAVPGLPEMHIVLVNPGVEMPTPVVFNALAAKENPPMPGTLPVWPDVDAFATWLATQRNDLEGPARATAPIISTVLAAIAAQKTALIARMSGSGATCFGLFATAAAAKHAAETIGAAQPQWWVASGPVYAGLPEIS